MPSPLPAPDRGAIANRQTNLTLQLHSQYQLNSQAHLFRCFASCLAMSIIELGESIPALTPHVSPWRLRNFLFVGFL